MVSYRRSIVRPPVDRDIQWLVHHNVNQRLVEVRDAPWKGLPSDKRPSFAGGLGSGQLCIQEGYPLRLKLLADTLPYLGLVSAICCHYVDAFGISPCVPNPDPTTFRQRQLSKRPRVIAILNE